MPKPDFPEFIGATMPLPQQWRGKVIWRSDLGVYQFSTGSAWRVLGTDIPFQGGAANAKTNLSLARAIVKESGVLSFADGLGVIQLDGTIPLQSGSRVQVGVGTRVVAADGRAQPLLTSQFSGNVHSAALFSRNGGVAQVTETKTWRNSGDRLYITGGPDATFRGLVTISTNADGNGYNYPNPGANGIAGTSGQFYNIIPVRRTLDASAFTAVGGGYVNVADPGHDLQPGDMLYLGSVAGNVFGPGLVKVTRAADGQWTYFSAGAVGAAAGTYVVSYDKDIAIAGDGYIDGNRVGCSADAGNDMRLVTTSFGCVNGLRIDCKIGGSPMRGVNAFNCTGVKLGERWAAFDNLVGFQAEGGVDGFVVDQGDIGDSQMYAGYPAAVAISSATNSATQAVVITSVPHGLKSGTPISTSGFTPAAYNVTSSQIVVDSPTQYRYNMLSNPGGAATVIGTYSAGQQADDYVAFTGTAFANGAGGNYDSTISPYGLSYFSGIDVKGLMASNALNAVKLTAMSTCPFRGRNRIGKVTMRAGDHDPKKALGGLVRYMDDGPGLVGTAADTLQLDGPFEFIGPNGTKTATAALIQLSGTGTINQISGRGVNGEVGSDAVVHFNGVTVGMLDVDASKYGALGANKIAYQLLSGTLNKLQVRNSVAVVGVQQPLVYFGGATVRDVVFENMQVSGEAAGVGTLVDYGVAAGLRSVTFKGIRTPVGGNAISSLMSIGNIAAGTLDVYLDDCDVTSGSVLTTPGSGGAGTFNVHMGSRFRWTATGGNNALQVGFGAWSLFGAPGISIPADKLALFGFGAPTYRIHMPSDRATVNINAGNYTGAQMAPVNGDQLFNNNAGALAVGPVVRRAGAWAAL